MSSIIDKIVEQANIVDIIGEDVDLQPKGKNFVGLCPFHEDNNPSFTVSPDKKIYKCFVCENGGNVVTFTQRFYNLTFQETLKRLASNLGIAYTSNEKVHLKSKYNEVLEETMEHFNASLVLYDEGKIAREYLVNRNINDDLIEKFKLGYTGSNNSVQKYFNTHNDVSAFDLESSGLVVNQRDFFYNRLIVPILDAYDRVVAFSGRTLTSDNPKYLNSKEHKEFDKSSTLYNMNIAKRHIVDNQIFICEGFFDVISLYNNDIKNVVATMGTSFTNNHIKLLKKFNIKQVVLAMDQDTAGKNSMIQIGKMLLNDGFTNIDVLIYDKYKDIDEFINDSGELENLIKSKQNFFKFKIDYLKSKYNINNMTEKASYIEEVLQGIDKVETNLRNIILGELSTSTNLPVDSLYSDNLKRVSKDNIQEVETLDDGYYDNLHIPEYANEITYHQEEKFIKAPRIEKLKNDSKSRNIVPTNDDILIKYSLISKDGFIQVQKSVELGRYKFNKHFEIYESLVAYYRNHDSFDLINYMDEGYTHLFEEIKEINLKRDDLINHDLVEKVLLKGNFKNNLSGSRLLKK